MLRLTLDQTLREIWTPTSGADQQKEHRDLDPPTQNKHWPCADPDPALGSKSHIATLFSLWSHTSLWCALASSDGARGGIMALETSGPSPWII